MCIVGSIEAGRRPALSSARAACRVDRRAATYARQRGKPRRPEADCTERWAWLPGFCVCVVLYTVHIGACVRRRPTSLSSLAASSLPARSEGRRTHSPAGISNNLSLSASSVSIGFGSNVVKGGSMGCGSVANVFGGGNTRLENICQPYKTQTRPIRPSQRANGAGLLLRRLELETVNKPPHSRSGKRPHTTEPCPTHKFRSHPQAEGGK